MTYPGFLIDVPEALLRGCRYLPLTQTIPLPGGTVTLRSDAEQGELLFGQLARDEEPFAMCLASPERAQSGRLELARYGVLGLISAHERSAPDEFTTTLLGVGRVRRGEPYLLVDEALPRVDCEPPPRRDALRARGACSRRSRRSHRKRWGGSPRRSMCSKRRSKRS